MAITNYIDSNGLRLMVAQLPSGAFDLYFSNGIISPSATHKRSSRTSSRGITFRNVNLQSGNGVEKTEHVEHKFKPTIMEKKIQLGPPGRPGPQIGQLLQRNRIQGAEKLQQYSGDPP